jgi:hypothetical protein
MLQKNFRLRMIISTFRMYSMDNLGGNGVRGKVWRQEGIFSCGKSCAKHHFIRLHNTKLTRTSILLNLANTFFFIDIFSRTEEMRAGGMKFDEREYWRTAKTREG